MSHPLDATDRELLRLLQVDGRRPFTHLADDVGLSETAVRQRVRRLIDSGTMQIVAVTDPMAVAHRRQALVAVQVHGDVRKVASAIAAIDEAVYVIVAAGEFDVLCEIVAEDDTALLDVINDRIRTIDGVFRTETTMYLSCEKQTYGWGTT